MSNHGQNNRSFISLEVNIWTLLGGVVSVLFFTFYIGQKFERYENLLTIPPQFAELNRSVSSIQSDLKIQSLQQSQENAAMKASIATLAVENEDIRTRLQLLERGN